VTKTSTLVDQAVDAGHKKVWGDHSLTLMEIIGFIIGAYLILRPPPQFGEKNGRMLGLAIIFITEALA